MHFIWLPWWFIVSVAGIKSGNVESEVYLENTTGQVCQLTICKCQHELNWPWPQLGEGDCGVVLSVMNLKCFPVIGLKWFVLIVPYVWFTLELYPSISLSIYPSTYPLFQTLPCHLGKPCLLPLSITEIPPLSLEPSVSSLYPLSTHWYVQYIFLPCYPPLVVSIYSSPCAPPQDFCCWLKLYLRSHYLFHT